jgi:hypothetical protein
MFSPSRERVLGDCFGESSSWKWADQAGQPYLELAVVSLMDQFRFGDRF